MFGQNVAELTAAFFFHLSFHYTCGVLQQCCKNDHIFSFLKHSLFPAKRLGI